MIELTAALAQRAPVSAHDVTTRTSIRLADAAGSGATVVVTMYGTPPRPSIPTLCVWADVGMVGLPVSAFSMSPGRIARSASI